MLLEVMPGTSISLTRFLISLLLRGVFPRNWAHLSFIAVTFKVLFEAKRIKEDYAIFSLKQDKFRNYLT